MAKIYWVESLLWLLLLLLLVVIQMTIYQENLDTKNRMTTDEIRLQQTLLIDGQLTGSGFMINSNYVMTNKHVVQARDGKLNENLNIHDVAGNKLEVVRVVQNPDIDLALIEIKPTKKTVVSPVTFSCEYPRYGEQLTAYGKVEYINFGISELTNITYKNSKIPQMERAQQYIAEFGNLLYMRGNIQPGNSGGPIFSENSGKFVGVATAYLNSSALANPFVPQHLGVSLAISSPDICQWLNKIQISYKE